MKITIITPVLNGSKTIARTIESVLNQNYYDLEYIIIDGGSSDGTIDIVNKYKDKITLISEKDHGIYDAMNKGLKIASGEIIGIINSDDYYCQNIFSLIEHEFKDDIDLIYGDLLYLNKHNQVVRYWRSGKYQKEKIKNGWIMPHPTVFVRKNVYQRLGLFNPILQIAADYELLLRFINKEVNILYLPQTIAVMSPGGKSSKNLINRRQGWRELKMAWKINKLKIPSFFIIKRLINKVDQYFV